MGGVARPTVKFTLMMMAKCTGCTPRFIKIGPRIGARIIIAGPASKIYQDNKESEKKDLSKQENNNN